MISRSGLQAIQAVAALAERSATGYLGASALAGTIGAPPNYLGKLLQVLAKQGLVESRKGQGGGFRLLRDPRGISLYEIVERIDSLERWSACVLGRPRCSDESPCVVHDQWDVLRRAYIDLLSNTTVADLVAARATSPPDMPKKAAR